MANHFFPYLYGIATCLLLIQAIRVMSRGFVANNFPKNKNVFFNKLHGDRTGQVTIHPELLNEEGRVTDEDLLTVRFSSDIDPPQSAEKSSD